MASDYVLDTVSRKMFEVMLDNPETPYNKASLAEKAGVSRDALYRRWEAFIDLDIVEEADTGSGFRHYVLNEDSELVTCIRRIVERTAQ